MNVYARYFEHETLAHSTDEVLNFLNEINDIELTPELIEAVKEFCEGEVQAPQRFKIRQRIYFILIKTTAETLEIFKNNNRQVQFRDDGSFSNGSERMHKPCLTEDHDGWYYCSLNFKRVIQNTETLKYEYKDASIDVLVKGTNGQDCYDKIITHLKERTDVDERSQFPSARGSNYMFRYVGEMLTPEDLEGIEAF